MERTDDETEFTPQKAYYDSELGRIIIYANKSGVTKIEFMGQVAEEKWDSEPKQSNDRTTEDLNQSANMHISTCKRWLHQYFDDPSKLDDVELPKLDVSAHRSRQFLVKVWQILRERTSPGQTVTYGKLAAIAGNSKASRSVGLAMRRNPFPIIVPCHRVIRSNAKIGNYSGLNGTATKKWLLDHEKSFCIKKIIATLPT